LIPKNRSAHQKDEKKELFIRLKRTSEYLQTITGKIVGLKINVSLT
jgi:hypothetical protein